MCQSGRLGLASGYDTDSDSDPGPGSGGGDASDSYGKWGPMGVFSEFGRLRARPRSFPFVVTAGCDCVSTGEGPADEILQTRYRL